MRYLARVGLLAATYIIFARLGLMMDAVSGSATLVWPPTGIALVALLRFGLRLWPGVALGAIVANLWNGVPLAVACGFGAGNTLEAVVGAWLLLRIAGFRPELARARDVLALVVFAALGSPLISASVGVLCLYLGGKVASGQGWETWRAWWLGDVIGALVVAPVLLTWWRRPRWPRSWREVAEPAALLLTLAGVGWLVFGPLRLPWLHHLQWLTPVLIWAALRFGQKGAAALTLLASAIAVWGTALGHGEFVHGELHERLEALQGFMAVLAPTFLLLGALSAEQRDARALAEQALAIREEFLSVASHELRTPATALQLSLQSLERRVARLELPPEHAQAAARAVRTCVRQTGRLMRLIEELLDVTRIQAGRLALRPEPIELLAMARSVVGEMEDELEKSGCAVTCEGDESLRGQWDRSRLEQVVTNLLSNAMKYGGKRPIVVNVVRAGAMARLEVRDQGIGIPPEKREEIFQPFERAVSPNEYGGLGLGLFIVRRIVEQHQGRVSVESSPGSGATFVVELPI